MRLTASYWNSLLIWNIFTCIFLCHNIRVHAASDNPFDKNSLLSEIYETKQKYEDLVNRARLAIGTKAHLDAYRILFGNATDDEASNKFKEISVRTFGKGKDIFYDKVLKNIQTSVFNDLYNLIAKGTQEYRNLKIEMTKCMTALEKYEKQIKSMGVDSTEYFMRSISGTYFINVANHSSWFEANHTCVNMGMKLVQIDTEAEYFALIGMISSLPVSRGSSIWFGLNDINNETVFTYQPDMTDTPIEPGYLAWSLEEGEPNNKDKAASGDANCASFLFNKNPTDVGWYDRSCDQKLIFVCEFLNFCTQMSMHV